MWYWYVIYSTNSGKMGTITSSRGWDSEWKAKKNIEARMTAIPPNIGLPKETFVVDVQTVYVNE